METDTKKHLYRCTITVRWGDMDAYGHVNNALYMRYLEETRVQTLAQMGAPLDGKGIDPVVVNVGCTFLQPVTYPDTLTIDCYADSIGRSSFMTHYLIHSEQRNGEVVSEGYSKVVWIDHQTGRSVPLPEEIRKQLVIN